MGPEAVLEARTQELGRLLYATAQRYRPSPGERLRDWLMGQMARDYRLRTHLLRFVDVLAELHFDTTGSNVKRLFREYFSEPFSLSPWLLRRVLALGRSPLMPPWVLAKLARQATRVVAGNFIAGRGESGIQRTLTFLERQGRFPSFDILGEQVLSREEASRYQSFYLELLDQLSQHPWAAQRTLGDIPRLQVSIKLSSLTEDFNPVDPEGTLRRVKGPLEEVFERAASHGIGVTIDAEEYQYRELTWYLVSQVLSKGASFGHWDGAGIVIQSYHTDADAYCCEVLRYAQERQVPFQVRLVKGAYWDYEVIMAHQSGWPVPVFLEKARTDQMYERLLAMLLESASSRGPIRVAVASHNVRCHAHAEALREAMGLPTGTVEHQTLFRTAEGISRAIRGMGWENRDYVPVGELIPGMAYLVRRVLENTSQVGFLMRSRTEENVEELLQPPTLSPAIPPALLYEWGERGEDTPEVDTAPLPKMVGEMAVPHEGFRNNPPKRLFIAKERASFQAALEQVRQQWGHEYPLELGGEQLATGKLYLSLSPSKPDPKQPLGVVHLAGLEETERAISRAREAFPKWSETPATKRARILHRAADLMRERRDELAAWIVYEGGRNWSNALADVDEAIDHLAFNADQLLLLAPHLNGRYRPRGVVAAIPPWNFPAALPMGMTSAALLTGNTVIVKSAEPTPIITYKLVETLHQAGVPKDALIHLPGPGESVGAYLVESPKVDMVAFTGSKAVGLEVYRKGACVRPIGAYGHRPLLKKVVAELGGKNAIIVFPDAAMDEAVRDVLLSAFEHSNQKCSACSRVFVHRDIYPRFRERLRQAALSLSAGLAEDPGTVMNPLINWEAKDRVLAYAQQARSEGRVLVDRTRQELASPLLVGPMIVELEKWRLASSVIAQEEIFGPILTLVPFDREREMVKQVNGTPYAMTAGIFSRSPSTISRMVREIRAGNVYVNRGITGARVGVEPFGGFQLSGTGPKTGSSEYLSAFVTRSNTPSSPPGIPPARAYQWEVGGDAEGFANQVQSWAAEGPKKRTQRLEAILDSLQGTLWPQFVRAIQEGYSLSPSEAEEQAREAVALWSHLLENAWEITEPQETIPIPGQRSCVSWETPRGKGFVGTNQNTTPSMFLGMVLGPLLAGNGLVLAPAPSQRQLAELLLRAARQRGIPPRVLYLAPQGGAKAALALADDFFHFAVTDVGPETTRRLYERLSITREQEGQHWIKALISMDDGPRPGESGFLRLFAIPKTIAVRTLRHGADLELV